MIFVHLGAGAGDLDSGANFRCGVTEIKKKNSKSSDKILYTTGRLTSEMIIKSALMGIPTLISRSGFTAWGVEIANKLEMTLIGRLRGRRFICLSGEKRLVRDVDPKVISDENPKDHRQAGND